VVSPTLEALRVRIGEVDFARLQNFIDELFVVSATSLSMLQRGGSLRPMVEASLAALIMYYPERSRKGQADGVAKDARGVVPHLQDDRQNPRRLRGCG